MAMIPLDWRIRRIAELVATFRDDHGRNPSFLWLGFEDYAEICRVAYPLGLLRQTDQGREIIGGLLIHCERTTRCFLVQ